MKRVILFSVFSLVVLSLSARTIYVKANSSGNGTSWSDAVGCLQQALKSAKNGDEIWVAFGKYLPTTGNDRNVSFVIPNGVKLYGGFAGYETNVSDRNFDVNLSILSGEIGSPSIEDNSYTVVYTKNVDESTVIDGFVITGGFSNVTSAKGDKNRCGAGWYNDGSNGASNPVIANCTFRNNYGRDGAGLYNYAKDGVANPSIKNCKFIANRADLDGGAIYNEGSNGKCSPYIENCVFEENEATYGAGVLNVGKGGEIMPIVIGCKFAGNIAYVKGTDIYDSIEEHGICEAIVKNCSFSDRASSANNASLSAEGK